ncbi:11401_t:CDS:2, partial [Entrophospora sp. SA101]
GTINPDNSETKDNNCLQWAICAFNADRLSEGKLAHLERLSVLRQYKDLVHTHKRTKDKWLAVNESSVQATSYQEQKPRHEELERP